MAKTWFRGSWFCMLLMGSPTLTSVFGDPTIISTPSQILQGMVHPTGVGIDSAGNIYVADDTAARVFKFSSSTGAQLSFAENNVFHNPTGVRVGADGKVYVVDSGTGSVYRMDVSGNILDTFSGMNSPSGVALDASNNVYTTDNGNNQALEYSSSGTVLKTWSTTDPGLSNPYGVATDSSGYVYISDQINGRIVKMNSDSSIMVPVQVFTASPLGLNNPAGVVVSTANHVFVADKYNGRIVEFDATGTVVNIYIDSVLSLNQPLDVILDHTETYLYAADAVNSRVVRWTIGTANTIQRQYTTPQLPINNFWSYITFDAAGYMYIGWQNTVYKLTADDTSVVQTFTAPSLSQPRGLTVDPVTGDVYCADHGVNQVFRWHSTGLYDSTFDTSATTISELFSVAIDSNYVYATDNSNPRIVVFNKLNGAYYSTIAPSGTPLSHPDGIFYTNHKLYVVDQAYGVSVYDVSDINSVSKIFDFYDTLSYPSDVTVDPAGNIFVVSNGDWTIREYDPTGSAFLKQFEVDNGKSLNGPVALALNPVTGELNVVDQFRIVVWAGAASTGSVSGDPQFVGYQQQNFQVHGTPNEYFNLISAPALQLNAKFIFIDHVSCFYNNTQCWTHPGTYMSEFGLLLRTSSDEIHKISIVAGSHKTGLSMSIDDVPLELGSTRVFTIDTNSTHHSNSQFVITHRTYDSVSITTPHVSFTFVNSNHFFNFQSTLDSQITTLGKHVCDMRSKPECQEMYPEIPIHGLLGQTWRNMVFPSGLFYEGTIDDYLCIGGKYSSQYTYNYFSTQ